MSGPYYTVCPCCGANLDPGEQCDCQDAGNLREVQEADEALEEES